MEFVQARSHTRVCKHACTCVEATRSISAQNEPLACVYSDFCCRKKDPNKSVKEPSGNSFPGYRRLRASGTRVPAGSRLVPRSTSPCLSLRQETEDSSERTQGPTCAWPAGLPGGPAAPLPPRGRPADPAHDTLTETLAACAKSYVTPRRSPHGCSERAEGTGAGHRCRARGAGHGCRARAESTDARPHRAATCSAYTM